MSRCHDCGSDLRFVLITTTNRPMPVDPVPDEDGNIVARTIPALDNRLTGRVLRKGEECPEGWRRYMPHVASCAVKINDRAIRAFNRRGTATAEQPCLFDTTDPEVAGPRTTEGTP